ncbi:MAG: hypothetical protein ABIB72_01425 [Candidatus Falkowbacteria bacterium]
MKKNDKKTEDCRLGGGQVIKGIEELKKMAKVAKSKYDKTDAKTKKQILAGIVGAAALIAGAVGARAIKKKMKK